MAVRPGIARPNRLRRGYGESAEALRAQAEGRAYAAPRRCEAR